MEPEKEVTEVVEEVVPPVPVVEEPNDPPAPDSNKDGVPDWKEPFDSLADKVNGISEQLVKILDPGTPDDITEIVTPDESPTKPPWTHRNPFKRDR